MKTLYHSEDFKREVDETGSETPWRTPVSRDYGRVIHSACFRRLQGKTQVFPGHESDFFRNRLTHSLEVAQIAEGIVERLNYTHPYFQKNNLNSRICLTAGLIHDLGHPPFGHNGERALDDAMKMYGGFEGNAQTLRIVSRTEKKIRDDKGGQFGLNLTFRTLAATLKYDREIPRSRSPDKKLVKGFYSSERELVRKIKFNVAGDKVPISHPFRTIECSIMDIADDIAYSTYDLEDCLKAGFLSLASILSSSNEVLDQVAKKVSEQLRRNFSTIDVLNVFVDIFDWIIQSKGNIEQKDSLVEFVDRFRASQDLASNGQLRTQLSTQLVNEGIKAVEVIVNEEVPALSTVHLSPEAHAKVEVLKQYTFITTIYSSLISIPEFRGYEVVDGIFKALAGAKGNLLMPTDVRELHASCCDDLDRQMRIICDFVAGMTDRYAMEFYGRLHSDVAQSMFKPV